MKMSHINFAYRGLVFTSEMQKKSEKLLRSFVQHERKLLLHNLLAPALIAAAYGNNITVRYHNSFNASKNEVPSRLM